MKFLRYLVCFALLFSPYSQAAERVKNKHPACSPVIVAGENVHRFYADLDGTQGRDTYVADRDGGTTVIYSCDFDTQGPWDLGDANKPANLIVLDVEGDGKDELLIGGPTATSPLTGSIDGLVGTNLVSKHYVSFSAATEMSDGTTFGCTDTNADEQREIINYTFTESPNGTSLNWLGEDESAGRFELPAEAVRAWMFKSGLCGNQIIFNYELRFMPSELKALLRKGSTVYLGINNQLLIQKTAKELEEASNWVIPVEHSAGIEGPFLLPSFMDRATRISVGEHNHCVGGPLEPPAIGEEKLIQLSIQPAHSDSCLNWFAVDFWVREDFTIAAIILNIWEP